MLRIVVQRMERPASGDVVRALLERLERPLVCGIRALAG
jgi:hypothetical protein